MPEVFRQLGYKFHFFANDHEPIHIHVSKAGNEAIYIVSENEITLRENFGMKKNELRLIESLIELERTLIIETWTDFFRKDEL
jgi:hypothetical protein